MIASQTHHFSPLEDFHSHTLIESKWWGRNVIDQWVSNIDEDIEMNKLFGNLGLNIENVHFGMHDANLR
jgi:predicted alpha/beta hydrolase family esterase